MYVISLTTDIARGFLDQIPWLRLLLVLLLSVVNTACQSINTSIKDSDVTQTAAGPIDPYDYNYCGSGPAYPIVGYTFATYCGPSNQVVLGRRGKIMWVFPAHGDSEPRQGYYQLAEKEIKHLTLLAEAAQLSVPPKMTPGAINYRLGIDFPGRNTKRTYAVLDDTKTPAHRLLRAMLELIPDKPALPDCGGAMPYFDPTPFPDSRHPLTEIEIDALQEKPNAVQ